MRHALPALLAAVGLAAPVLAQGGQTYREGEPVPRNMTALEKLAVEANPITAVSRGALAPSPEGLRCPGEYEPMDGILLAWEGQSSWTAIVREMAVAITTLGDADVYIAVDNTSERNSVSNTLDAAGADMSRVNLVVRQTDTIWIRDYGPRYVFQGDVRAIVDHTYNRPRPTDNAYSTYFAANAVQHNRYDLPLVHGGGNYHLSSLSDAFSTELIADENPGLSDQEIVDIWADYQAVDTNLTGAFPTFVDSTQHIDMWMIVTGDRSAIISEWVNEPSSSWGLLCESTANRLINEGWNITRVPAARASGTHYTYTNAVICNDIVLVPTYTRSGISGFNDDAIAAWQAHMPGKTIVPINCEGIVSAAGVMHCICMHLPRHVGGENPTAYLEYPRGGQNLTPGRPLNITWLTDDDQPGTRRIDLLLSTDGGDTFNQTIATNLADTGAFSWSPPDIYTENAVIRVVVRDNDGNEGSTQGPGLFTIAGTPLCAGDADGNGTTDLADLNAVLSSFGTAGPFGDVDGNGAVDLADLNLVLSDFGCN